MVNSTLNELIETESREQPFPAAAAMVDHVRTVYGSSVRAVVFYGSCLRMGTDKDLMLDLYVLVGSLKQSLKHPLSAAMGTVLPPNVYYHECDFEGRTIRAKVAVMALGAFVRGTADTTFASAIWARFAQPAAIVYASDDLTRDATKEALARAVNSLISKTLPLMTGPFSTRDLWVKALRSAYEAELRPEPPTKADELIDANPERFDAIGTAALAEMGADPFSSRFPKPMAKWVWRLRSIWGRLLNVLRLIKAAFTFKGGLSYAVWKLERHRGEKIELTDRARAYPLWTGLRLLFSQSKDHNR